MGISVVIKPERPGNVPEGIGHISVELAYQRKVGETSRETPDLPTTIVETIRSPLDSKLRGSVQIDDALQGSQATLRFLSDRGETRLEKSLTITSDAELQVRLSAADVKSAVSQPPQPDPGPERVVRVAQLVPTSGVTVALEASSLQVAPLRTADGGWTSLGLEALFRSQTPVSTSMEWNAADSPQLAQFAWTPIKLGADGRFTAAFDKAIGDAWLWWLSGPSSAVGVLLDDLGIVRVSRRAISLPPFAAAAPPARSVPPAGGDNQPVPADVTEAEVALNPQIYTEDAGAFCRPFQNPERILGERSFFVLLRAEQPAIGPEPSVRQPPLPVLNFEPPVALAAARIERASTGLGHFGVAGAAARERSSSIPVSANLERVDAVLTAPTFTQHGVPDSYRDALVHSDRGRAQLDAAHPVQWEGDATRYQAMSMARGHILELRIRWRSNGYSLGTVARTLTLAPRQTRRIQKIEWRRSERARREERTQLDDRVTDEVTRERTYEDEVRAGLSEWAHGESESSTTSGAGGFGFAAAGFVIGGGGGGSSSNSSSNTEGGRRASASEQQRLNDQVRRWADALRKLDSIVVTEVTQEESVTGTTEVVRNPNYGHALTVLYHQILRHLKVETAFAGVRECLFVPFALRPFTPQRVSRWHEPLMRSLRDQRLLPAFEHIDDVLTGFATSDIPPGRRSDQRVWHFHGSLFVRLGIERPVDAADGSFDEQAWKVLLGLMGTPVREVHARLVKLEAKRDRAFQREHAPRIAAGWVNTLELWVGNDRLPADFTLASGYRFNDTVRIDFSVPLDDASPIMTRERLASWRVVATRGLTPGSVANVERAAFTYQTDHFARAVSVRVGADDLVNVETGVAEAGAAVNSVPDDWERRDQRLEMIRSVQELVGHLNEHVEHYHKAIWWSMDRDRIWMLLDGFYVPGTSAVSVASVVERDPIAIVGNSLVFRVSAGSFIGIDGLDTPAKLHNYYAGRQPVSDPMLISLPTDGLYAQTIMDECEALEEHFGNTDWVLSQVEPELGTVDSSLLASRRAEPPPTTPTPLPQTIINLQNAPEAPAPSGVAGALSAVSSPAFRDLAGLEGTQTNARAGLEVTAGLASSFGAQATALKLAEIAQKEQAAKSADKKLATAQRAVDKKLVPAEEGQRQANKILEALHTPPSAAPPHESSELSDAITAAAGMPGSTIEATTPDGFVKVALATPAVFAAPKALAGLAAAPYGQSDTVPDVVFIPSDWNQDPLKFLQRAHEFHSQWRLQIVEVNSLEEIVQAIDDGRLHGDTIKVSKRFRIVSHATDVLLFPLFRGWPVTISTDNAHIEAAAKSDFDLVDVLLKTVNVASVMSIITSNLNGALVGPTTITSGTAPTGALETFITRRAERQAIDQSTTDPAPKTLLFRALDFLLAESRTRLKKDGATDTQLNALGTALDALQPSAFTLPVTVPGNFEQDMLRSALDAINRGFRTRLTDARKKLKGTTLDVRGCSIGKHQDSLQALSNFFSAPGTTVKVTAPDFSQGFPGAEYSDVLVADKNDLETKMSADTPLVSAMSAHATSHFGGKWAAATTPADQAQVFFDEVFAKDETLPVFHVEFDLVGNPAREVLRLFMKPSDTAILRFLVSLWGIDLKKRVKPLQAQWKKARSGGASLPKMPAVSKHLHARPVSDPNQQELFVCPMDGYRAHIRSFP